MKLVNKSNLNWSIKRTTNGWYVVDDDGNYVAALGMPEMGTNEYVRTAHLLASAPELLDALKGMLVDLMALPPTERANRFVRAIEAVEKAEGSEL